MTRKMQPLFDMSEWEREHRQYVPENGDFGITTGQPIISPVGNLFSMIETLRIQQQEMFVILKDMKNLQQNMLQVMLKNQREIDQLKGGLNFVDSVFQ